MTIEFNCPNCQNLLRTTDDKAGRQAKCPNCGGAVTVPQATVAHTDAFDLGEVAGAETSTPSSSFPAATAGSGDTKRCPMCGETIKAAATLCRYCGEDFRTDRAAAGPTAYLKPHRGTMVLVLSILGWAVCCVFGIPAFVMAQNDLKEMKAGIMDPSGEGTTKAAKIISLVQFCFVGAMLAFYAIIAVVGILSGDFQ